MATAMKQSGISTFEAAAEHVRELNERVIESSSNAGVAGLQVYGRLLERLAESQEHAGKRGSEWLSAFGQAQATFTRDLAQALPAAARRSEAWAQSVKGAARRQARRVPGAETVEGEIKGAVATNGRLPIARYDKLNAKEIESRLSRLSKVDLGKIDAYERKHKNRATVLKKIESLRAKK
jgi:hypothetical protein